jgi:archaeal cell division control protein 6
VDTINSDEPQPKTLFNFNNTKVFKNPHILDTSYVPDVLVGRDDEIQAVADIFYPIFVHGTPGHAFIYGPPGAGKTVVLEHVFRQLYLEAENSGNFPDRLNLKHITISCKKHDTTVRILTYLIMELEYTGKVSKRGVTSGYYYDIFYKALKEKGCSLTIIFDEIDHLRDDNILYNFSRSGEFKDLNEGQFIHIIGVSNSGLFINSLDPRVDSSMQRETIIFPPYNEDQLIQILNMRVPLAFCPNVVSEGTVNRCAKEAAEDEGDARRAIYLLQTAGHIATKTSCYSIQPAHVVLAAQKIKEDVSLQFVLNMSYHEKFVLLAMLNTDTYLKKGKYFTTGDVYRIYYDMCKFVEEEEFSLAAISQKVSKFKMMGIVNANTASKGRGGLTSQIVFIGDPTTLKNAIFKDGKFIRFVTYVPDIKKICSIQIW